MRNRATAKIARNRRNGVNLEGTKHDVRREPNAIKGYTRKQLAAYMKELDSFNSRKTQFVGDRKGRPIPKSEWTVADKKQRQVANKVNTIFDKFADIKVRKGDETIRQRMAKMTATHRRMGNVSQNAPYQPPVIGPHNLDNPKAVKAFQAKMDRKLDPKWIKRELRHSKRSARKMLQGGGRNDLWKQVEKLNDAQFFALWNFTSFADDVALNYDSAQNDLQDEDTEPWYMETSRAGMKIAEKDLNWAKTIKVRF